MAQSTTPNYGVDAPCVVRRLALFGLIGFLAAMLLFFPGRNLMPPALAMSLAMALLWSGLALSASAGLMLWGSKVGKLRLAKRMIAQLSLRGDEQLLDVGCGHGLMLITAAKHLSRGKAIGLDLWQTEDQAGNRPQATLNNAQVEGVADRVELKTGDARQLPFPDSSFDAVVSSWALHNIYDPPGRERAVREIARVLRPGGRVAIVDIRHAKQYARVLRQTGFEVACHGPNFAFAIPSHWLIATKTVCIGPSHPSLAQAEDLFPVK